MSNVSAVFIHHHNHKECIGNIICQTRKGVIDVFLQIFKSNDNNINISLQNNFDLNTDILFIKLITLTVNSNDKTLYALLYRDKSTIGYIIFDVDIDLITYKSNNNTNNYNHVQNEYIKREITSRSCETSFVIYIEKYKRIFFTVENNIYTTSLLSSSLTSTDHNALVTEKLSFVTEIGNINNRKVVFNSGK
jgi:hypothetical protein